MYIMNRTKDKLINTDTAELVETERCRVNGKDVYRVVVNTYDDYVPLADYDNEEAAKDALCEIADAIVDGTKMLEML